MGESVTVPFLVNGIVKVSRTYSWVTGWRELTRQVAADLYSAPALQLEPVELTLGGGERGVLCVDTGSPNGSVVVHFYEEREPTGSLSDLLDRPVKITRAWWVSLVNPYGFDREPHPGR